MNTYDPNTGQVFKEWTVPRRLSIKSDHDWSQKRAYPLFVPRGARGPRSLVDTAINVIANNIGDLTERHLDYIPTPLLWRIWRFLEARGICFHAWRLFSAVLLREEGEDKNLGLYRFRQHICRPGDDLTCYLQPLTSPTTEFISHLVLSGGCSFNVNDLLCLTDMKNLGILELIRPADDINDVFPHVSDRLIRGWSEKERPFPLLRILRIWGDQLATARSLHWVAKFPSLVLYDVMGLREDWASRYSYATEAGWLVSDTTPGMEDSLLRRLLLLVPDVEPPTNKGRDFARSVDSDLITLCSDSQCAVKFVPGKQASPLLEYLTDTAKVYMPSWDPDASLRAAGACQGVAFEAWGFWLFSFIGQLNEDKDMSNYGLELKHQAVAGPFVLPSRPLACLFLGHSGRGGITTKPSYVSHGLFSTRQYTFTRDMKADGEVNVHSQDRKPASVAVEKTGPPVRKRRRRQVHDILLSFSRGSTA